MHVDGPSFLTVGGARLEYRWIGPGPDEAPTIVFLHEGLGSVSTWRDFPMRLAEAAGCGALVYSRAGHGRSDSIELPRSVEFMHHEAEVLDEVLRAAGVRRAVLFGHSDGASIALIHAGRYPCDRVAGLVLEAPHVFVEDVSVQSIARIGEVYRTTDLCERLARHHQHVDVAFGGWNGVWLHPEFRAWNIEHFLSSLRVPTLVIQGEADEYGTWAQVESIQRRSGGPVGVLRIADCGHAPHVRHPEPVIGAAARFIANVLQAPSPVPPTPPLEGRPALMAESARIPDSDTLRVQQELAHQLELTRNITENVAEGLCLMDSDGRLTYMNPAAEQLLGWTQEELLGRKLHEAVHYLHPDGSPFPMETCPLGLTLRDGTHIRDRDDVWIRKGGVFVDVSVTCTPIIKDGAIVGSVLSLHETTEQKRAAEALRQAKDEAERANQAKSDFLAAMSHELRTPLNAIAGYLDLLHLGIHGPITDAQSQALVRIKRNQEHLLTLINDVLNFARVEAGHIEFAIAPIAVDELLAGLGPMVEGQAQARGLAYTFERCDPSLRASGDPSRVRQILLNLVGNATKFTEPGGWIVVWCEAADDDVRIFVRDNGAGIPPDRQAAIFDPFVQGERRLDRPVEGVGLGLAISRDLARGMSGELTLQSAPGEGSTFCLRLPRAPEA